MSKQTDNKQFWQRWASCYGPLMQSSEPLYAAIAQQMQPHLTPEMNVLELACGSGQLSFRLSRLVRDWEATDFSPKMIAQAKLKPRGAGLHFSVQDATSLPYADETFDAVLIANALHIMPRPEKALAEIYRVLKPGGQLFAPTFVHGEVPRTRLRMLAMRCAGLQIYNSWMVPQYLAFLQAGLPCRNMPCWGIPWPRCAMPALCRTKRAQRWMNQTLCAFLCGESQKTL